jgi:hypothetical protein
MSASEQAYRAAERAIARANSLREKELSFASEEFRALDRIPQQIAKLTGLQSLELENTKITDLAPLAGMKELYVLRLSNNQITDLVPLAGMTGLQTLTLNNTWVTDLAPLAGMTGLRTLYLYNTEITDLAPLAGMTGIHILYLHNTQITDLAPLAGMTGMQILFLNNNQITNLKPLKGMMRLKFLKLSHTTVTDVAPLGSCKSLETIVLDNTGVQDLRPLAKLEKLGTFGVPGLSFADTPATKRDKRLAELGQIKDHKERTRETLAYLRTLPPWPDPYTPAATPNGSPPQPIGDAAPINRLTLEAILKAQTPLGWRFSADHGSVVLFVEEHPLDAFQSQLAMMTAERLKDLMRHVGNAAYGIRGDLRTEGERFEAILNDDSQSFAQRSFQLWGSLVALGSLLDASDQGRRDGQDSMDLLSPQQRAALQTLLQVAGNFVRSFPDVQKLDDGAGGFLRKAVTLDLVAQLIENALKTRFVSQDSAALMQHVKEVAEKPGKQGEKAASVTTRGTSNLAITAAMIAATPFAMFGGAIVAGAGEQVGSEIAVDYKLGERAIDFIELSRESLAAFIDNLPPDEAARLRSTIEDTERSIAERKSDME